PRALAPVAAKLLHRRRNSASGLYSRRPPDSAQRKSRRSISLRPGTTADRTSSRGAGPAATKVGADSRRGAGPVLRPGRAGQRAGLGDRMLHAVLRPVRRARADAVDRLRPTLRPAGGGGAPEARIRRVPA